MSASRILGVIPARFSSERLPGKPLIDICGKPMIQWTYESCSNCEELDDLIVATDDKRIYDCVIEFGGKCIMTSYTHKSGTSRLCEVADKMSDFEYYINIQGDQPFISKSTIAEICSATKTLKDSISVMTLICGIKEDEEDDISIPKVIVDKNNRAIYFSRFPIPFIRATGNYNISIFSKHLGVYGFTKSAIKFIKDLKVSYLEEAEKLEQLTWIYEGIPIYVSKGSDKNGLSVDTEYDLKEAIEIAKEKINHR
jgi:3-deoxy-manno-octulosonate cytidylyltransferase (CMP-KDO synthetase)